MDLDERDQNLEGGGTAQTADTDRLTEAYREAKDRGSGPGVLHADLPDSAVTQAVDVATGVTATPVHDISFPSEAGSDEVPTTDPDRLPTDPGLRQAVLREQARGTGATDTPSEDTPSVSPILPLHRLGQTVWFRSRTGAWTAPAIVTATVDSLNRDNVTAGHVPDLSSGDHVHLTVLTPGIQGHVSETTAAAHPELVADDRPNKPAGGSFQEWDIAYWEPTEGDIDKAAFELDGPVESALPAGFDFSVQPAGTWMWPL